MIVIYVNLHQQPLQIVGFVKISYVKAVKENVVTAMKYFAALVVLICKFELEKEFKIILECMSIHGTGKHKEVLLKHNNIISKLMN